MKKLFVVFLVCALLFCVSCSAPSDVGSNSSKDSASTGENTPSSSSSNVADSGKDEESEYSFEEKTFAKNGTKLFDYYLYTPASVKENSPLVVYLHGGSGIPKKETDGLSLLTDGDGLPKFLRDGNAKPNYYVVMPQLPLGKKGWSHVKNQFSTFLDGVIVEYGCDKTHVSITGHSMEGKGTWDISLAFTDKFYKIAPLSGSITTNDTNVEKLKNKPVWAIVGSADTIVDPKQSENFIAALKKVNTNAKITVLENYDHFMVVNAYLDDSLKLLEWLVA
ncbi:MAG TPA: hypothetical protein DDY77_06295 [Clostridiales bacterium]|nr:hypothetical protein [Clostridiales bacterium]